MSNGLFVDKNGEEDCCNILKSFVEEYGPEHVTVKLPRRWKEQTDQTLGTVATEFSTESTIEFHVEYETMRIVKKWETRQPV